MQRFIMLFLFAIAALCVPGAAQSTGGKKTDIVVLELKARRDDGKVTLDGKIRNGGGKKLEGVILIMNFLAPGKVTVTTQKATVGEDLMQPGQEAVFHAVMVDPVRAVELVVTGAEDTTGRELKIAKKPRVVIE